jgi:acyl carrier protein
MVECARAACKISPVIYAAMLYRSTHMDEIVIGNENLSVSIRNENDTEDSELRQWLITNIAAELQIDPGMIDVQRNLDELGLDSLQAVCLAGDLEKWLGVEIPETAIWDYPTIESMCKYLTRLLSGSHSGN